MWTEERSPDIMYQVKLLFTTFQKDTKYFFNAFGKMIVFLSISRVIMHLDKKNNNNNQKAYLAYLG